MNSLAEIGEKVEEYFGVGQVHHQGSAAKKDRIHVAQYGQRRLLALTAAGVFGLTVGGFLVDNAQKRKSTQPSHPPTQEQAIASDRAIIEGYIGKLHAQGINKDDKEIALWENFSPPDTSAITDRDQEANLIVAHLLDTMGKSSEPGFQDTAAYFKPLIADGTVSIKGFTTITVSPGHEAFASIQPETVDGKYTQELDLALSAINGRKPITQADLMVHEKVHSQRDLERLQAAQQQPDFNLDDWLQKDNAENSQLIRRDAEETEAYGSQFDSLLREAALVNIGVIPSASYEVCATLIEHRTDGGFAYYIKEVLEQRPDAPTP